MVVDGRKYAPVALAGLMAYSTWHQLWSSELQTISSSDKFQEVSNLTCPPLFALVLSHIPGLYGSNGANHDCCWCGWW